MNEVEQGLLYSLLELENAIGAMAQAKASASGAGTGSKPNLLPLFEKIDGFARQLPRGTDPTLMHYLQKRSYEKARLYLQGREAENQRGNCRHV